MHQESCPTPTLDTAHRHTRTQTHMHTQHIHSLSDDLAPHCRSTLGNRYARVWQLMPTHQHPQPALLGDCTGKAPAS